MKQELDLKNYFSNQMFLDDEVFDSVVGNADNPEFFGVDCCAFRYIERGFGLHANTSFDLQYIKKKKSTFEKDVIRCNGQYISVPHGQYKKISFLGGCVWDYFCEYVTVHYDDGTAENKQFFLYSFSEWGAREYVEYQLINDCPCKDCYEVLLVLNGDQVGLHVYQFDLKIDQTLDKNIVGFTLPENENMCIFAITLE